MSNFDEFNRSAAEKYLQNIVFVDDEIYIAETGHPTEMSADIPPLPNPFKEGVRPQELPAGTSLETKAPYHPKHLVESFARKGMVCALYEPKVGFDSSRGSELFNLCERADVVILDWDLFNEDGRNVLPLIAGLVDESQNTVPHHARLCAIYTSKPNLQRVTNEILQKLNTRSLKVEVEGPSILVAGATRIVVLGKPDVPGRPSDSEPLVVREEKLADRIIDEFANMNKGILPSYALKGLASIRKNSKRILDKFHSEMDGPFLLHRASLLGSEDSFEQLPDLLAEELLAVMVDEQAPTEESRQIAEDFANSLPLKDLNWPNLPGRTQAQNEAIARRFLGGGEAAVQDEGKLKPDFQKIHTALGCGETHAEKRLAALFTLRTRYFRTSPPCLGFGTIVRRETKVEENRCFEYSLCLMPACDSIRLKPKDVNSFPFWRLKPSRDSNARGIVVQMHDNYESLFAGVGKPREMLWLERFTPGNEGMVCATEEAGSFLFNGENSRLEWVAQLKPAHAQRLAHDIAQLFSRVGVAEAEWLRPINKP